MREPEPEPEPEPELEPKPAPEPEPEPGIEVLRSSPPPGRDWYEAFACEYGYIPKMLGLLVRAPEPLSKEVLSSFGSGILGICFQPIFWCGSAGRGQVGGDHTLPYSWATQHSTTKEPISRPGLA